VVALVVVCIPLGREWEVGYIYALYSHELMRLMYYLFLINEDLIPFQKKKKSIVWLMAIFATNSKKCEKSSGIFQAILYASSEAGKPKFFFGMNSEAIFKTMSIKMASYNL
jgi:hypothetical protein